MILIYIIIHKNIRNNNNKTPSNICRQQIQEWTSKLAAAERDLAQKEQELIRYQRIEQQKQREFNDEKRKYDQVESDYLQKKSKYDSEFVIQIFHHNS